MSETRPNRRKAIGWLLGIGATGVTIWNTDKAAIAFGKSAGWCDPGEISEEVQIPLPK